MVVKMNFIINLNVGNNGHSINFNILTPLLTD